jgi:hypothetical protein
MDLRHSATSCVFLSSAAPRHLTPTPISENIQFDMPCYLTVCPAVTVLMIGGSLAETAVVRAGFNFSYPLRVGHVAHPAAAETLQSALSSIQFSGSPNVILETIKRGEDDDDVTPTPIKKRDGKSIILRIYEAYGGKGSAKVSTYVSDAKGLILGCWRLKRLSRRIFLRMRGMRLIFSFP